MTTLLHHDPASLHVYTDNGRFYRIGEELFPGVSTILSSSDSLKQQQFWKQWNQNPENSRAAAAARERGILFHSAIERYFRSDEPDTYALIDTEQAIAPYLDSVKEVLPRVSLPILVEGAVWHTVARYAGTVDLVGCFDGIPAIIDWKTTTRPKKPEWLGNYPLQLAAYCGAINRMYNTGISHGVVVFALPDAKAQVFQFQLLDYWFTWLARCESYYEQQQQFELAQAISEYFSS